MKTPTLSIVLEVTFDAVSSWGVRASVGLIADCAGVKAVRITASNAPSAYTKADGPPESATAAAPAIASRRVTSETSMIRSRG